MSFCQRSVRLCLSLFAVLCSTITTVGCSARYVSSEYNRIHQRMGLSDRHQVTRPNLWRLSDSTSVLVVKPSFPYTTGSSDTDYPRTRYHLLMALERAFLAHYPNTQIATDSLSRNDALIMAQLRGCRVVVYPQLLDFSEFEEGAGLNVLSRLKTDKARVQVLLLDVYTGRVIDKTLINSRSQWFRAEQNPAQDLFTEAAAAYVGGIVGKL